MSATPEQIAFELEGLAFRLDIQSVPEGLYIDDLRAAASLIRAQSERERVLVSALRGLLSQTLSNQAPNGLAAVQAARAALYEAKGAP